jgi:hypothetical protein
VEVNVVEVECEGAVVTTQVSAARLKSGIARSPEGTVLVLSRSQRTFGSCVQSRNRSRKLRLSERASWVDSVMIVGRLGTIKEYAIAVSK